jgi:hypothetical protein
MTRGVRWPTEEARLEALREAQRRYSRTEKGRAKYARYRETDGYAAAQERFKTKGGRNRLAIAHRAKVKAEEPAKYAAWMAVAAALRNGQLVRGDACESCGRDVRLDAHHHRGYAEGHQLDVLWLCRRCHKAAHGKGVV